jgi:hypothetical protein
VTESKPVEELDGLVYGMAVAEDENADPADDVWYRNPKALGFSALGLTVVISLFFI